MTSPLDDLIARAKLADKAMEQGNEVAWIEGDTKASFLERCEQAQEAWGDVFLVNVSAMPDDILRWWLFGRFEGGAQ